MGTSNFYSKSKIIFAVELETEFCFDDLRDNVTVELNQSKNYSHKQKDDYDRNYHGTSIGTLSLSCPYKFDVSIEIKCYIRYAYYEGCNLDYEINYAAHQCDYDNIQDLIKDAYYYSDYENNGMTKLQSKNLEKWLISGTEQLINEVEKIFTDYSEPLNKVATFSNGETIYKKVS